MLILIDGHNLVPKIPGLSLSDPEDEMKLVGLLQEYARLRRKKIEVFFDHLPVGWPRLRRVGTIVVRFSRPGYTADGQIRERLEKLGKEARNCLVVSSDFRVQNYGRVARAQVLSSELFAKELGYSQNHPDTEINRDDDQLSEEEIKEWMQFFGEKKQKKRPESG